jgi:peptide/nickel transport system ATP-binding protein
MATIIKADRLVKEFNLKGGLFSPRRTVHAVDDVSFEIAEGEVLGLAGESGSGKSTTGRLLLRLIEPTSGTVTYRGKAVTEYGKEEMRKLRQRLQIVFQDPVSSLSPRMSVGDAIGHPLLIHDLGRRDIGRRDIGQASFAGKGIGAKEWCKARVLEIMEKVGLSPAEYLYRKYPHQLSGGQSQRVVLARALVTNPDFVVADEPIAMADVSVRALILRLMQDLKAEFGLTYLFITHDLATAKYLCDRVAIMYLGRIVELASRDELFSRPHHPYAKALLAAVPIPDPRARKPKNLPGGEIPSAIDPPSGCHFHPRCAHAVAACKEGRPPLREIAPGHLSACILD